MKNSILSSPPAPQSAIRIGVPGLRTSVLAFAGRSDLLQVISALLASIIEAANVIDAKFQKEMGAAKSGGPLLRIIAPLAPGADCVIAREALKMGFDLMCILPYPANERAEDFVDDAARSEFRELLQMTTILVELDGRRSDDDPYTPAAQAVLRDSDVMVVVNEHSPLQALENPRSFLHELLLRKVPSIYIETRTPTQNLLFDGRIIENVNNEEVQRFLLSVLGNKILPPNSDRRSLRAFLSEKMPRFDSGVVFRVFRSIFGWGPRVGVLHYSSSSSGSGSDWAGRMYSPGTLYEVTGRVDRLWGGTFEWADRLATYYGGLVRSSAVAIYLLGAMAVLISILGLLSDEVFFIVEAFLLGATLTLFGFSRLSRWEQRWDDYRRLAERLRKERIFSLLPVSAGAEGQGLALWSRRWVDWYVENLLRSKGLVSLSMDNQYLRSCYSMIESDLTSFRTYLHISTERYLLVYHRLNLSRNVLFFLGMLSCSLFWLVHFEEIDLFLKLTAICLPAFGVAISAIMSEGKFKDTILRSEMTNARLEEILGRLRSLDGTTLRAADLRSIAADYSYAILSD